MKWKKILLSGLGGLLLGGAAILVSKRKKSTATAPLEFIPEDAERVRIETEEMPLVYRDEQYTSRGIYTCTVTSFKVWSLLTATSLAERPVQSRRIYHISPEIHFQSLRDPEHTEVLAEENFYATLHLYAPSPRSGLPDHIARGRHLEFRKCHVGGSMNGVETGEKIITVAPVAAYEIGQKIH